MNKSNSFGKRDRSKSLRQKSGSDWRRVCKKSRGDGMRKRAEKNKSANKKDERISGDSDSVETVLKVCQGEFDSNYLLKAREYDFDKAVDRFAKENFLSC